MTEKISFDLVSPERLLLSERAVMVTVPGAEGDFGVLAGHAPTISALRPGVITVDGGDLGNARFFVLSGFTEVTARKVTVLAEDVLPMDEIDAGALDQRIRNAQEDILHARTATDRARAVETLDHLKLLRAALHPAHQAGQPESRA